MNADTQQFDQVVAPHFNALYRAAFRLTRNRDDAEDLVQEVCLRALQESTKIADLGSVLAWLLRVQYRLFVDGDRRRRRSPIHSVGATHAAEDLWPCERPGPEELADSALQQRKLDRAWKRLTPEQRGLLALHAEGYGLAELEQATGMRRNAVSARLHRARKRLSSLLYDDAGSVEPLQPRVTRE